MQVALNKIATNEMILAVSDQRRLKLLEAAEEYKNKILEDAFRAT